MIYICLLKYGHYIWSVTKGARIRNGHWIEKHMPSFRLLGKNFGCTNGYKWEAVTGLQGGLGTEFSTLKAWEIHLRSQGFLRIPIM